MNFHVLFAALLCLALNLILNRSKVFAKRDPQLYCGACTSLIAEIQYAIDTEDPRRTIDVGSFRIDPKGKTKHDKIPFAGSEIHLHDVVEDICDKMTEYAVMTNPETQEISYVRFLARGDETMELENVSIDTNHGKKLRIACANFLEDFEDDIIALFKAKHPALREELCVNISGYCKSTRAIDEL